MPHKKQLIKSGIMFQLKLGLDAIRYLFLSPVSIVALLIDLISKKPPEEGYFHRLMVWGRFSDHWINLFYDKAPGEVDSRNVDSLLQQLEIQVLQKNLSENGKQQITKYLEMLRKSSTKSLNKDANNDLDKQNQSDV
ncbi:MAG: hypothetical protein P8J61_01090 [Gammaproteobacteria bacterium]|nr:hypothetical protein [Gammaproteobacteria bacterium]